MKINKSYSYIIQCFSVLSVAGEKDFNREKRELTRKEENVKCRRKIKIVKFKDNLIALSFLTLFRVF